jgi:outer membrane biosynthesis protein TonB
VNTEPSHDQDALQSQIEESRERLGGLAGELHAVDAELEEFSAERAQHDLLGDVCSSLEKLSELGGSNLFWGDRPNDGDGDTHVGIVRRRVDTFQERVGQIEQSRLAVLERVAQEQDVTDDLEYDLLEARREEELRKQEWLVEREMDPPLARDAIMPWSRGGEDDWRFRKSLGIALLLSLLLGLVTPLIDLPVPDRWEVVQIPERLTRLIKQEPPPPPPQLQAETRPEEKEPELAEEEPVLAEEKAKPEPAATPVPKENVKTKGILAFRESFSSLADAKPSRKLGAQARVDRSGEAAVGLQGRSLVASQVAGTSTGINVAAISRDAVGGGGGSLEGVDVGGVTSGIGAIAGEERPLSGGPSPARTDEEIQIVFDRHKSALYRLYNRELRRDPTLKGQIVLRLTIQPDGSVSLCEVQSSDMQAPKLSAQVTGRVKKFDFGAKEGVSAVTILYPIDFLPAA